MKKLLYLSLCIFSLRAMDCGVEGLEVIESGLESGDAFWEGMDNTPPPPVTTGGYIFGPEYGKAHPYLFRCAYERLAEQKLKASAGAESKGLPSLDGWLQHESLNFQWDKATTEKVVTLKKNIQKREDVADCGSVDEEALDKLYREYSRFLAREAVNRLGYIKKNCDSLVKESVCDWLLKSFSCAHKIRTDAFEGAWDLKYELLRQITILQRDVFA